MRKIIDKPLQSESGLIHYNDINLTNGTYWYTVAVVDFLGKSFLSSSQSVVVGIPTTTTQSGKTPGFEFTFILLAIGVVIKKRKSKSN